jgi:hypothetical protein
MSSLMAEPLNAEATRAEETSLEYLGQWDRLVSTTNWAKGRIIHQWRTALIEACASASQYSDEAWSRRTGNVSPQHVGRLRRVFERFAATCESYAGLYWSHFQAALDWNDAEMWLEGAVQNRWSVAQMRTSRWEAQGAPADLKPRESDVVAAEIDEDSGEPSFADRGGRDAEGTSSADYVRAEGPDFGDEDDGRATSTVEVEGDARFDASAHDYTGGPDGAPVRPFENLPQLPPDLADALESFKLAILHHKLAGWPDCSRDDVVASLDALRQLALAAS